MRRRLGIAAISAGAPLALLLSLLLSHCGGTDFGAEGEDVPLPDRVDLIDSTSDGDASDAQPSTDAPDADASAPPAACNPKKPFGTPARLPELDAQGTRSTPRLSADELTIYFTTGGAPTLADLTRATRASLGAPFTNETILAQSGTSNDNDPSVGADHLSLWFHSGRAGTDDIFVSTRASTTATFGAALPVADVDQTNTNENHPYFRAAGNELWFISDRAGAATGYDIYMSERVGNGFGAPVRVNEVSSPSSDWQPQPSEDGLTLLFASDRAGGKGLMDLWLAERDDVKAPFRAPVPLTELNSANGDNAGWLSADRCRIWFSSGRNTGDAHQQLFYAERPF